MLVLDIKDQTVTNYDPLYSRSNEQSRGVTAFLNYVNNCNKTKKNNIPLIPWKEKKATDNRPFQQHLWSSGYLIMFYMELIGSKKNFSYDMLFDPMEYQREKLEFLLIHSLPINNVCFTCELGKTSTIIKCNKCKRWAHAKRCSKKVMDIITISANFVKM